MKSLHLSLLFAWYFFRNQWHFFRHFRKFCWQYAIMKTCSRAFRFSLSLRRLRLFPLQFIHTALFIQQFRSNKYVQSFWKINRNFSFLRKAMKGNSSKRRKIWLWETVRTASFVIVVNSISCRQQWHRRAFPARMAYFKPEACCTLLPFAPGHRVRGR